MSFAGDLRSARPVVLIVDDHPDVADMMREYLAFQGARAIRVGNAAEARTLLRSIAVDVIVTDYAMPDEDGLSFIRALRETSEWGSLPIIMASGQDTHGDVAVAARAVGATFLAKPIDLTMLSRTVAAARQRASEPRARPRSRRSA